MVAFRALTYILLISAGLIVSVLASDARASAPASAVAGLPAGFSPATYIGLNPDLQQYINDHPADIAAAGGANQWAINHYLSYGRNENRRFQNDAVAALQATAAAGGLPAGFRPGQYIRLNKDLKDYIAAHPAEIAAAGGPRHWAINHYLNYGKNENRQFLSKEGEAGPHHGHDRGMHHRGEGHHHGPGHHRHHGMRGEGHRKGPPCDPSKGPCPRKPPR